MSPGEKITGSVLDRFQLRSLLRFKKIYIAVFGIKGKVWIRNVALGIYPCINKRSHGLWMRSSSENEKEEGQSIGKCNI